MAACVGIATATALLGACQTDGAAIPSSGTRSSSAPSTTVPGSSPQTAPSGETRSSSAPSTTVPGSSPQTAPTPAPVDTSSWLPFVSEHYGLSIAYPPGWEANQGRGGWDFPDDTAWPDGVEVSDWFYLDDPEFGSVAASVWWVGLEQGMSADEWFTEYCAVEVTPCDGTESSVAASLDGHAGRLVRASDPLAYFGVGDRLYMLAVWEPDDHPSVERYGGGHRLLEAFLSTIQLLPDEQGVHPVETTGSIDTWLDTSTWATHVSDRYQFTIGHPATWSVIPSSHEWNQETDSINWDSGGLDVFVPPDDMLSMYLAAWSVEVAPATTLAEWVRAFCDHSVLPCADVNGISEQAFASAGELEGVLLAWDDGMITFFPDWFDEDQAGSIWDQSAPVDGRIYIVESGRPDSGPYHAREFIEAFSASLCPGCDT